MSKLFPERSTLACQIPPTRKLISPQMKKSPFGAFLEIEPGIEGLIHISEMSWGKKIRKTTDVLAVGNAAEAIILALDTAGHRISLGLKQAPGIPGSKPLPDSLRGPSSMAK